MIRCPVDPAPIVRASDRIVAVAGLPRQGSPLCGTATAVIGMWASAAMESGNEFAKTSLLNSGEMVTVGGQSVVDLQLQALEMAPAASSPAPVGAAR
jgi:hypothetical protein